MDTITVVTLKGVLLGARKDMGGTRILRELCVNVEVSNTEPGMMSFFIFLMLPVGVPLAMRIVYWNS